MLTHTLPPYSYTKVTLLLDTTPLPVADYLQTDTTHPSHVCQAISKEGMPPHQTGSEPHYNRKCLTRLSAQRLPAHRLNSIRQTTTSHSPKPLQPKPLLIALQALLCYHPTYTFQPCWREDMNHTSLRKDPCVTGYTLIPGVTMAYHIYKLLVTSLRCHP